MEHGMEASYVRLESLQGGSRRLDSPEVPTPRR
jgi:hypothetical protein